MKLSTCSQNKEQGLILVIKVSCSQWARCVIDKLDGVPNVVHRQTDDCVSVHHGVANAVSLVGGNEINCVSLPNTCLSDVAQIRIHNWPFVFMFSSG